MAPEIATASGVKAAASFVARMTRENSVWTPQAEADFDEIMVPS
jgi:hypothetical protein